MRIVLAPSGVFRQSRRHACRAFSTSSVVKDAPQSPRLPPARLRALMSLYHNSSTFITPATLSARIDFAFTDPTVAMPPHTQSSKELQTKLEAKRTENKFGTSSRPAPEWRGVRLDFTGAPWSDQRGERQTLVGAALWGTDLNAKPSLETVLETREIDKKWNNLAGGQQEGWNLANKRAVGERSKRQPAPSLADMMR